MLSKKLITAINSFSFQELSRLRKFVNSPYFNENQELVILYEEIYANFQKKIELRKPLLKKEVWKKVYPNTKYVDVKMRRLTSELTRLVEKFIAIEELKRQKEIEKTLLLTGMKTRSLDKHFFDIITKNKVAAAGKSTDFHFEKLQTEILQHEFYDRHSPQKNSLKNLAQADYHLDSYYLIKKLKFYCSLLSYKSVKAIDLDIPFTQKVISEVSHNPSYQEPAVQVYLKTVLLLQKNEESKDVLDELLDLLILHENAFPLSELRHIYINLQNFCAGEINNGKVVYFQKLFDVYKITIERNILTGKEPLKPGVYKNIITLGLMLKEFNWTENFIQKYTDELPKTHQENAKNYNLAKVYFHKKEYEKVIEQLREVEYKELVYALGGKLMLLKTYFELKETRPLDSLIDSFRIYLRRNKLISKNVRQQYMNVLRFTKKLANIAPYDNKGVARVKGQIEACKTLADKKWLLDKVSEME